MTHPPEPIIELREIAKHFGGVQALRGVDMSLFPGEVHALVGENGAGKSTLVKILAGIHRPDAGALKIGGEVVELRSPTQAQALGIAVVQQEPMLFPDLDVAENVFMGRHPRDRFGRVDWKRIYREVDQLFASLDVSLSSHMPVQGLSVAEQQLVEIAKALTRSARVIAFDEPTSSLSEPEVQRLFEVIRKLRSNASFDALPIIWTTAAAFNDTDELQNLHVSLLEKPFAVDDVVALIKNLAHPGSTTID